MLREKKILGKDGGRSLEGAIQKSGLLNEKNFSVDFIDDYNILRYDNNSHVSKIHRSLQMDLLAKKKEDLEKEKILDNINSTNSIISDAAKKRKSSNEKIIKDLEQWGNL